MFICRCGFDDFGIWMAIGIYYIITFDIKPRRAEQKELIISFIRLDG